MFHKISGKVSQNTETEKKAERRKRKREAWENWTKEGGEITSNNGLVSKAVHRWKKKWDILPKHMNVFPRAIEILVLSS